MRLTLRTMLAFLDDILEPADSQEVGKKIQESEFATTLVHRMRDVTRRLRLGAPKLYGKGMGLDPNTVAEYLDNTLLSERVADFEKVCLESDVHLAEVASCHQILALVLGEPAEVETTSRQRLYEVIREAETAGDSRRSAKDGRKSRQEVDRQARRKKKRRRPKVPEYLRESAEPESPARPWAAVVLIVVLLSVAAIVVGAYRQQLFGGRQVAQQPGEQNNNRATENERSNNVRNQSAASNTDGTDRSSTESEQSSIVPTQVPKNTGVSAEEADGGGVESPPPPEPDELAQPTSNDRTSNSSRSPNQTDAIDQDAAPLNTNEPPAANDEAAAPPPTKTKTSGTKTTQDEPSAAEGVGRLISERDVLLRFVDDEWQRVPGRGTVYSGQRLIALPTYRPSVAMSSGVTLQLVGGALAELGKPDDDGVPDVRLSSGRLLVLTVAKPGAKIHLRAGDYAGTVEFGKDEAVLAVEVTQRLPEGADPEQEAAPVSVDLYLTSGQAKWTDQRGRSDTLRGRVRRSLDNPKREQQAAEELPVWVEGSDLNPTEKRASSELEPFLRADKPVAAPLTELATHRKIEISLLATQSLALIEDFKPIVPLLNDPRYRIVWPSQIECLRNALARGPKTAALVREAFEKFRDKKEGDELYRMLWGYTADQLEESAAAQLIGWLDAPDEKLDFRVLSFWNLHHITGLGLYYQPADPEKQRRTSIQKWKLKLESGLIVPRAT
jgi:cytoskeletal protein RodZ